MKAELGFDGAPKSGKSAKSENVREPGMEAAGLGRRVSRVESRFYEDTRVIAEDWYRRVRRTMRNSAHGASSQIQQAAESHPFQVIAGVAGVAFAGGVLLRVWRSNRHA